jgi:hypothetical protein
MYAYAYYHTSTVIFEFVLLSVQYAVKRLAPNLGGQVFGSQLGRSSLSRLVKPQRKNDIGTLRACLRLLSLVSAPAHLRPTT